MYLSKNFPKMFPISLTFIMTKLLFNNALELQERKEGRKGGVGT